jgi:hypothetical protein
VALLCLSAARLSSAKDYDAGRFDVDLKIQPDGSALVTETVVFQFRGGPFTYVYRDIPTTRTDGIREVRAAMDGRNLAEGHEPGEVEIHGSNPVKIIWHFPPVSDSAHTFVLSYRALGVVRVSKKGNEVVWAAIPPRRNYRIQAGRISLEYPESARPAGTVEVRGAAASLVPGPRGMRFELSPVRRERALVITASFEPGSFSVPAPRWQARDAERAARIRSALPLGGAAAVVCFAAVLALFLRVRSHLRQETPASADMMRVTQPPSDLPPAVAARLVSIRQPVGRIGLATLFDLADRGAVRIEEMPGRLFGRDFRLELVCAAAVRLPHECALIAALFGDRRETRLSQASRRLLREGKEFDRAVVDQMAASGLLDLQRHRSRGRMVAAGVVGVFAGRVVVLGGVVAGALAQQAAGEGVLAVAAGLVGAGAGTFLASLAGLLLTTAVSPLSAQGAAGAIQWRAFARYLSDIAKGREAEPGPQAFPRYLAYAAAFGLGAAWVRHFERRANLLVPGWFRATGDSGDRAALLALIAVTSTHSGAAGAGVGTASGGGGSGAG